MASLCDAIQRFHDNNLLYLDCKPDNIFFYTYDHREDHVRLFDFDTVMPIDEIKAHPEIRSYSKGWAPSELVMGRSEEIGKETDIFSVGAVFFWLFTGRSPWDKASDIMDIENGLFQWNRIPFLKNASTDVASLVRHIAEKTLLSYSTRYHDISRLKADFIDLAAYTEGSVKTHKPIYEVLKGINDSMLLLSQQEVNPKEATEIKCDEGDKQRKTG